MNKSYVKGYVFERNVIKKLEKLGAIVIRSGKSKFPDGEFCLNKKHFYFECKYNNPMSGEEYSSALKIIENTNTPFLLIRRQKGKRTIEVTAIGGIGAIESLEIQAKINFGWNYKVIE